MFRFQHSEVLLKPDTRNLKLISLLEILERNLECSEMKENSK